MYAKPFRQGQKNDFRDAHAVAEAVQRPTTRFVPAKTNEQLDLQALHRVRSRLVSERTAVINQIRGFLLERGIVVRQGPRFLRQQLPDILAKRTDVPSPRMARIVADLANDCGTLAKSDDKLPRGDDRAGHRPDHLECRGGGDRQWRRLHAGTRLRRLAGARTEARVDRRSHDPGQDLQAPNTVLMPLVRAKENGRAAQPRPVSSLSFGEAFFSIQCVEREFVPRSHNLPPLQPPPEGKPRRAVTCLR